MSNEKEKEAVAFKEWFTSQRRFSSLSAMERALNITEDYLHLIKDGKRRAVDPDLRRKLHEATGLEIFKPIPNTSGPKASDYKVTELKNHGMHVAISQKEGEVPENLSTLLKLALKKLGLTIPQCSEKYGISPDTLQKYKSGTRKPSSDKNVAAVLNILEDAKMSISAKQVLVEKSPTVPEQPVDIKALTREVNALRRKVDEIDRKLLTAKLYGMPGSKQESVDTEARAKRVMQILLTLNNELEFFKQCPETGREIFRKIVPGPDVGYVTTLLRALYDEDKFQRWLLFSNYEMRGKNNGD